MSTTYFHADNSNRRIKSGKLEFDFHPYARCGASWQGMFFTDKEDEIAALRLLVKDPRSAVTEITEADYLSRLQKKTLASQSLMPSPKAKAPAIEGNGNVVVAENVPAPDEPKALTITEVITPKPVKGKPEAK